MTEPTGDRRARRSRKLLKQGLLELLREKGFSHISVRDITERMDLNRGTFYLHYPDTTALMRSVESDLIGEIQALVDAHMKESVEGRSLRPVFEPVLDYVVAHRETCAALFNSDSASGFLEQLQKLVYRNGKALLWAAKTGMNPAAGAAAGFDAESEAEAETGAEAGAEAELLSEDEAANLLSFVAFGLVGLVKTWFDGNMALPREDLLRMADALTSGAVEGFHHALSGGTGVPHALSGGAAAENMAGPAESETGTAETPAEPGKGGGPGAETV